MNERFVFVSYSTKDDIEVDTIVKVLENAGIACWRAPKMIGVGSNYAKEIPKAITNCRAFLLILSENSQNSIWVEKELDFAINERKTIVPLMIGKCRINDMFKFYLNNVQTINYNDNSIIALGILRKRLLDMLNDGEKSKEIQEKTDVETETRDDNLLGRQAERKKKIMKFLDNTSGYNPQPVQCEKCAGEIDPVMPGIYKCRECGAINYDPIHKVSEYLKKHGASNRMQIIRDTGVSLATIEHFFKEGVFEVKDSDNTSGRCVRCGRLIKFGNYCDKCLPLDDYSYNK